ncbi:peptidase [Bacillus cereus group sp. BfR-BA-01523]|uniref:peptidase n=1 Tax=Bacillus cereus group sp. BfR-BA-01523 TaxID=2920371 RepID=UPI001F58846D|nr:peptidase [Bacillus cereus group sp. BfR-BA-01523]
MITFKVYDRTLVELAIANQLTYYDFPITIVIENQDSLPILDSYEENEFIPITFNNLAVYPKKVQKTTYANGSMIDTWQFTELKVSVSTYKLEKKRIFN